MKVGGILTTEKCNLSCIMCHFNGPDARRKARSLKPETARKFLREIPTTKALSFAGTGELFTDPNAIDYLQYAIELGHKPFILTNGQLLNPTLIDRILEIGIRKIQISVDAIDEENYKLIRRGGKLSTILDVCNYLMKQKTLYPDIWVEINNIVFQNISTNFQSFTRFWQGKADQVNFNAEYYEVFKYRNLFFRPKSRVPCKLAVFLLPSGHMSPCCAITVYQHIEDLHWLPHIADSTPMQAYKYFTQLYNDPNSKLRNICNSCQWWMVFIEPVSPVWYQIIINRSISSRIKGVAIDSVYKLYRNIYK